MTVNDLIQRLTDAKADGTIDGAELVITVEYNRVHLRETPVEGFGSKAPPEDPFKLTVERRRRG